jgi:mannose-6-phosphate isomerase
MEKAIHIDKPWGYERHLEINDDYVVKELFMKEGNSCSLQYHEKKHETFYVLKGKLKFYIGPNQNSLKTLLLEPGEHHTIEPRVVHRMEAVVDSLYLESSTNFLDDVIRLEDQYGRA